MGTKITSVTVVEELLSFARRRQTSAQLQKRAAEKSLANATGKLEALADEIGDLEHIRRQLKIEEKEEEKEKPREDDFPECLHDQRHRWTDRGASPSDLLRKRSECK